MRNCESGHMALQKLRQGGRPYLGDRHQVATKIPIPQAEKLRAVVDILGTTTSSYIAKLIADDLAKIDLDEVRNQEILPIDQAS